MATKTLILRPNRVVDHNYTAADATVSGVPIADCYQLVNESVPDGDVTCIELGFLKMIYFGFPALGEVAPQITPHTLRLSFTGKTANKVGDGITAYLHVGTSKVFEQKATFTEVGSYQTFTMQLDDATAATVIEGMAHNDLGKKDVRVVFQQAGSMTGIFYTELHLELDYEANEEIFIKRDGAWKAATKTFRKVDGAWAEITADECKGLLQSVIMVEVVPHDN